MLLSVGDKIGKFKKTQNGDVLLNELIIDRVTKKFAFSGYAKFRREINEIYSYPVIRLDKDSWIEGYKLISEK